MESSTPVGATAPDADTVWLATKAVAALTKTFRAVGLDATEQGTTVSVAGRSVGVAARINNRDQQNSRHLLAAEFDIFVGGSRIPTLLSGAVGVDDTPEHARDTAAAEWATQYGAPIGFALASRFGASGPPPSTNEVAPLYAKLEIDGQALFHGPPRAAWQSQGGRRGFFRSIGATGSHARRCQLATNTARQRVPVRSRSNPGCGYCRNWRRMPR